MSKGIMVESQAVTVASRAEPKPPVGVIESLSTGFEITASHIGLLLIPILLDLFLWLGPTMSIYPLQQRFVAVAAALPYSSGSDREQRRAFVDLTASLSEQLNVFSLFNTTPIGVPSLMTETLLTEYDQRNPSILFLNSDWRILSRILDSFFNGRQTIASANHFQLIPLDWQAFVFFTAFLFMLFNLAALSLSGLGPDQFSAVVAPGNRLTLPVIDEWQFVLLASIFTLIGFLLTAVYYSLIGSVVREPKVTSRELIVSAMVNWAKLTAFNVLLRVLGLMVGLPFLLVMLLLQLVSAPLSGIVASFGLTAGIWFLIYASFTMQSMVLQNRGVFGALWDSVRMVQVNLFAVIGLSMISFLLNWGMSFVFSLPASDSWLRLAGIGGHAFVATGLVVATFVFYKDRYRWWTEMRQWLAAQRRK